MPAHSDPNNLGIDPGLLDRQQANFSAIDLDIPLNNSPSSSSNHPAPPQPNQQPIWGFTSPHRQQYSLSDTLVLEGWVEDTDGFDDIDRIDLELNLDDDRILDLGEITQFSADPNNPNRATFSYNFALKSLAIAEGSYDSAVDGIAYDRSGNGSANGMTITIINSLPYLAFRVIEDQSNNTLTVADTGVQDEDGLEDLSHIDFRLRGMESFTNKEIVIDLPDVTEFISDHPDSLYGTFDYNLDLNTVDIPVGFHRWTLEGNLIDKAGNSSQWENQQFYLVQSAPYLEFHPNSYRSYSVDDTLTLVHTRVEDRNGIDTLDRIDFQWITEYDGFQRRIDLPDVTEFIPDHPNATSGTFNYSLDLSTLPSGRLEGILYDKVGNFSSIVVRDIFISREYPLFTFSLDRDRYSASETLTVSNGLIHRGFDNIDRIDFQAIINGERIDVADATVFIPNSENSFSGTFEYNLDLRTLNLAPGYYNVMLNSIAYTKSGLPSDTQSQYFTVTHTLPENLEFSLDRQSYTTNETLTITGGSIIDRDSAMDIDRIDFRIQTANGTWIDLPDVTAFNIDANSPDIATFDYNLALNILPLDNGIHVLQLHGSAIDRLGNINTQIMREFELTKTSGLPRSNETHLNFYLNQWDYTLGDTLILEDAWIEDLDGIAEIDRIDFVLQTDSGLAIDIADVTQFISDPNNPYRATFSYALDLKNLGLSANSMNFPHNFTLTGIAYDEWGQGSQERDVMFSLSNNAPFLHFFLSGDGVYGVGETITLTNAWVEDYDGLNNLDRIDFQAIVDGYTIDLPDVTEFTPEFPGSNRGTFDYSLDLWSLGSHPGSYDIEIKGILYDKDGNRISQNSPFHLNHNRLDSNYRFEESLNGYYSYTQSETLALENSRIWGFEDIADLDRIDFRAMVEGYGLIDLPDVTEFTLIAHNEATFDYSFKIEDYFQFYDRNIYNVQLEAILYNKSVYGYPSNNSYYNAYDFQVTNYHPNHQFLVGGGNHFTVTDTLTLQNTWVEDMDGIHDIDRIEFVAIIDDYKTIELPDVTQFNIDSNNPFRGSYEYSVDLKMLGLEINYSTRVRLEGTVIDKAGNMGDDRWQSYAEFTVGNYLPNVDFALDRSQYSSSDTLTLSQGWLEDEDGIADIDRIEVRLFSNYTNRIIDVADINNIIADPTNSRRGTFDYTLNLADLGLELGNYDLFLKMTAYDKAGNGKRGMWQSFQLTNNVPNLYFHLLQGEYRPDDTLTLTEAWVEDADGLNDLDRVDFSLRNLSNGELIDVADVVDFTADPGNATRGSYAYSLYLGSFDLQPGNYDLEGIVIDKQGNSSPLVKKGFAIAQPDHAPQDLRFSLDKSEYTPNATILLNKGWIMDEDGAADLARVNLRLFDANDNLVTDLNPVTDLDPVSWDPLWASFNAQINLNGLNLADGTYTISAIAYDITNQTSNVFERSFGITSPPPNFVPSNLTFSLDSTTYQPTDTINLGNGWVRDENGAETFDRIDLRIVTEQGNTIDIDDITNLNPASWNPEWASFQYGVSLNGLNLQKGAHKLVGIAYDREGAASSQFERNFYLDIPQVNLNPTDLRFTLDQNTYNSTDTLEIGNGWISDGDGSDDLESVTFKIVASNGNEIDLGAIANFTHASWSPEWASFSGSFDLSQYNLIDGNYTLVGVATDKSGGQSQTLSRAFAIETPQTNNTAPAGLQFGLSGSRFSANDTLQISNGWVYDDDGNSDLVGVDFELVAEDGTAIDLEDSFALTAATWDWSNRWSSFRHSINLSTLGLSTGSYTVRGKAYDQAGDYSNIFSRSFTLV